MLIKPYGIVYLATSPSGKGYVGCTKHNLATRSSQHKHQAFKVKAKTKFYDAIRKYGFEAFTWSIIEECTSKAELLEKEVFHISRLDTYNKGYNLTPGGEAGLGCITEAHKKKLSIRNSGKGNPRYGANVSEETRRKISEGNKGKSKGIKRPPRTADHCKKLSEAAKLRDNSYLKYDWTDKKHSNETIKKMQNSSKTKLRIRCLNNGEVYGSAKLAAKALGIDNSSICKHLKGLKSHVEGFRFVKELV